MLDEDIAKLFRCHGQGGGSRHGAGFPLKSPQVMHQVKLPSVYGSLLMLGYNFLPLIYNELVAIQEHRDLLAHKVVRDGVMHSLDYYRAILVNVIALLLKAADLLSEG